jgi:hypothetical protein
MLLVEVLLCWWFRVIRGDRSQREPLVLPITRVLRNASTLARPLPLFLTPTATLHGERARRGRPSSILR